MKSKLFCSSTLQKKAVLAARAYLEKKSFEKSKLNAPVMLIMLGITFFFAFILFTRYQ